MLKFVHDVKNLCFSTATFILLSITDYCYAADPGFEVYLEGFTSSLISAYSSVPVGTNHLLGGGYHIEANIVRDKARPSSELGLFAENVSEHFWYLDHNGKILHEANYRTNNLGLHSRKKYVLKKDKDEYRVLVLGAEQSAATTASFSWPDYLQDEASKSPAMKASLRRLGKKSLSVINFGQLDTSFQHYELIFEKRALKFKPDLIIVNAVAHDHFRTHPPVTDPPGYLYPAVHLNNGKIVGSVFPCTGGTPTYSNTKCQPTKLLILFVDPEVAQSPALVKEARDKVLMLGYLLDQGRHQEALALPYFLDRSALFAAEQNTAKAAAASMPPWNSTPESRKAEIAASVARIAAWGIPTIVTYNPWLNDFETTNPAPVAYYKEIERALKGVPVVDMRAHLPCVSPCARDKWYSPISREKWTDEGHRIYAKAELNVIMYHMRKTP